MDAAGRHECCYVGMTMSMFNCMRFPLWLDIDTLAPFTTIESHLNGFMCQCQFYFECLFNPKPEEKVAYILAILVHQLAPSVGEPSSRHGNHGPREHGWVHLFNEGDLQERK